jgi:tetratricopeptide (TPR) repeat protein
VAESAAEGRIKDLKRRLELEPGSRLFVALAEEYRKSGRLADALSTLQKGLLAHPNYLSAQVALGRAYLEAGQITEAIATFSRVLSADPGNLVSAKSLADIHMSRGDSVEAVKKYKLYRALSGDRSVDEIVERLEVELAPPPPSTADDIAPPPPPAFYDERPAGSVSGSFREGRPRDPISRRPVNLDATSVRFELEDSAPSGPRDRTPLPLSRDVELPAPRSSREAMAAPALPPPPSAEPEAVTRVIPPEAIAAAVGASSSRPPKELSGPLFGEREQQEPVQAPPTASEPQGRVLADLYFAQGHYAEALAIYDDLVASQPHDEEVRRLRRDAEARLLPAAATISAAADHDPALEHRLTKIRALKRWLSVVQTG